MMKDNFLCVFLEESRTPNAGTLKVKGAKYCNRLKSQHFLLTNFTPNLPKTCTMFYYHKSIT